MEGLCVPHRRMGPIVRVFIYLFVASVAAVDVRAEDQPKLYWSGRATVSRANLDGSNIENILATAQSVNGVTFDSAEQKVYFIDDTFDTVCRINLDGTGLDVLLTIPDLHEITFDPFKRELVLTAVQNIYSGSASINIYRATLDGSQITKVFGPQNPGVTAYIQVNPVDQMLYFYAGRKLYRQTADGSITTVLHPNLQIGPSGVAYSSDSGRLTYDFNLGKLYYLTGPNNIENIRRMNFDGSGDELIIGPPSVPGLKQHLHFDAQSQSLLYFNNLDFRFKRLRLNTLTIEDLTGSLGFEFYVDTYEQVHYVPALSKIFLGSNISSIQSGNPAAGYYGPLKTISYGETEIRNVFVTSFASASSLGIDNIRKKLYWSDPSRTDIFRADLDGKNIELVHNTITGGSGGPANIEVDTSRERIYWTERVSSSSSASQYEIYRAKLDGKNREVIYSTYTPNSMGALTLDPILPSLFWAERNSSLPVALSQTIYRAIPDGTNPTAFVIGNAISTNGSPIMGLASDPKNARLYWSTNSKEIRRIDLNSTTATLVEDSDSQKVGLSVDPSADKLYWIDLPSATTFEEMSRSVRIRRSNLDGSGVEDIVTHGIFITSFSGVFPSSTYETAVYLPYSGDLDEDGGEDLYDSDDDNDGLSDEEERAAGTDPRRVDTDRDGISDHDELEQGTNPLDAGSYSAALETTICSEWNGFLGGLWNILEFTNLSGGQRDVESTLYGLDGNAASIHQLSVLGGAQSDLLVHNMPGWTLNSYGQVCSIVEKGKPGDIDGRMVYYKQGTSGFEFAFAMPFSNGLSGDQFVPFNTFQPSLAAPDAINLVTNWIQITNLDQDAQTGDLYFYSQEGELLGTQAIEIQASARRDFSAHQFGPNLVGLVRWHPKDKDAAFQVRNVRYYYDNPSGVDHFTAAFQLEGVRGSGEPLVAPLDTTAGSSIIEIGNTLNEKVSVTVQIYDQEGQRLEKTVHSLPAHGSKHIIADGILMGSHGIVILHGSEPGSLMGTVMQYGRTATGGLNFLYGIQALEPTSAVMKGTYNTFLAQGCELLVLNVTEKSQKAELDLVRYDGTKVRKDEKLTIPARGMRHLDLCSDELDDVYGVVTITAERGNALVGHVIRLGANDEYRFPTPVR